MKLAILTLLAVTAGTIAPEHQQTAAYAAVAPAKDNAAAQDWPAYNGGSTQDHFSSLSQINRQNVKRLKIAWKFDTGEAGGMQTNPLIVGRTLYAYTATQKVIALDASTGRLLWKFDSGIVSGQPVRGMAYWTDGRESRILAGIMNFLYALDPATGKPIPTFGENGRIDLRKELRGDYKAQSIVLTSPGTIYKDLIIVGGRNPETPPAPPGDIRAFDVHTGALRWRFRTIPHPGEPGNDTWPRDAWKTGGAANNWAGMALDEKRGVVYVPTGSAVPDFYGGARTGNDLFADTLLALDAASGKLLWYFQGVHHDVLDRDFPSPPLLITLKQNGRSIDAIAQTTKQGLLFVLDRTTGKPLFPIEERSVPASTTPGEITSPTQPFPLLPAPYARQSLTEAGLTNRTPEAHAWALEQFRTFRSAGPFAPLAVGAQTIVFPGFDGGAEWGGPAADPATGVIYINANDIAWTGGLEENDMSAGLGLKTYQSQCALCHRDHREGSPPDFPSLIDVDKRLTSAQISDVIHQGKGRMPSYPNLQDDRLKALLEYLRTGTDTSASADGKEMTQATLNSSAAETDSTDTGGAAVYANDCAVCHGEKREGLSPSFPSLLGIEQRLTPQQITDITRTGKGRMPAFTSARLSDADLTQLLHYLGASDMAVPQADALAYKYRFTGYKKFYDPDGYPAVAPPWGTLNAIDLSTGKYLWKIPLGEYPALAAGGAAITGTENYGGPIVTAGGLVFIGATIFDRKIRAFDTRTGKLLWQAELPYAGLATPATYMVDGRQYVVIAAGGGRDPKGPQGGAYVAFVLP